MEMEPGRGDVEIQLSPVLDLLARSLGGERRVASVVKAALRAAGGPWRATITPSAALEHFWVVRIARPTAEGPVRSVVFDERSPVPDRQLAQAISDIVLFETHAGRARGGGSASPRVARRRRES